MTATILAFPVRKADNQRLALLSQNIKNAVPIPPQDAELDLLLQIGGKLLDNLNDFQAVDVWLVRLEQWEAKNAG